MSGTILMIKYHIQGQKVNFKASKGKYYFTYKAI